MKKARDPYAAPHAPRDRGGPILRFAIIAALLAAAVWGFTAFWQPELATTAEMDQRLADAGPVAPYPAETPTTAADAALPPEAPTAPASPAQRPAPSPAAPPAPEPPPPTTTTVPPE